MSSKLYDSIRFLKGIGPKRAGYFSKLGISTVEDLLYYFPRRYEDRSNLSDISRAKIGDTVTIRGKVTSARLRVSWKRRGFKIFEALVYDGTGMVSAVWFNQAYLKQYIRPKTDIILHGKIDRYGARLQISSPEFEVIDGEADSLSCGRIVPVYPLTENVTQRVFRRVIKESLDEFILCLKEILPEDMLKKWGFLGIAQSIVNIHFPESEELRQQAFRRLCFEEFFLFQVPIVVKKLSRPLRTEVVHVPKSRLAKEFIGSLPFKLTDSQKKVIIEIAADMGSDRLMQRLLQGDVGSGKTLVALCAALIAVDSGWQVAVMVPTEILANQHYLTVKRLLERISGFRRVQVGLLCASLNRVEHKKVVNGIKAGEIDIVIGTHSLIEKGVGFKKLGLIIIDEQHKFGVGQRSLLTQKSSAADILLMTATPIPRTLSITLYGNLDISTISELPSGRGAITTRLFRESERQKVYGIIRSELDKKQQAYIIYPLIGESELLDLRAAEKMFGELKNEAFKGYRLGLVHGRLKQDEQMAVMEAFKNGEIDILVATTVLEVGIDIPNATVMLIENAEHFGLSQLHQLRGRIGRGKADSYCLLLGEAKTEDGLMRLRAFVANKSGFRISEEDLKIRGPGEFFGSRQHGLSELKIGNPLTQLQLLKSARDEAVRIINSDFNLIMDEHKALRAALERRYPGFREKEVVG